jgi:ClpP class serine protease
VSELADEIVSARAQKPVVAIANSLAASAAYWIGCSASEFYVTPGGEIGSIGVWQAHFDYSQAFVTKGVTVTLISAGKYKVEGNPYVPLDEKAQGFMQSRVDDYYASFTKAVARWRGVPIARCVTEWARVVCSVRDAAKAQGMIDGDGHVRRCRQEDAAGCQVHCQTASVPPSTGEECPCDSVIMTCTRRNPGGRFFGEGLASVQASNGR